jgi:hypothetical protein
LLIADRGVPTEVAPVDGQAVAATREHLVASRLSELLG